MTTSTIAASYTKLVWSNSASENDALRLANLEIFMEMNEDFSEISQFLEANSRDSLGSYKRGFLGSVGEQFSKQGFLSDKQVLALRNIMTNTDERKVIVENKESKHIAKVDDKVKLALQIDRKIKSYGKPNRYNPSGINFINLLSDSQGNRVIYFGTAKAILDQKEDSIVELECKIKSHTERDGILQTVISHPSSPKVLKAFPKRKVTAKKVPAKKVSKAKVKAA